MTTDAAELEFGDAFTNRLGFAAQRTSERSASAWLPTPEAFRPVDDVTALAALAFITDATPGVTCGAVAVPSWVVTTDLFLRLLNRGPIAGPLRADAELTVHTASIVAADVVVVDEGNHEQVVSTGSVGHLVREPPEDFAVPMNMPIGHLVGPDEAARSAAKASFNLDVGVVDGELTLARSDLVTNPLGHVHGSVLVALAVERLRRQGLVVSNVHMRFARPVRGSGARTRAALVAEHPDRQVWAVELLDVDRLDRVAGHATIEAARP